MSFEYPKQVYTDHELQLCVDGELTQEQQQDLLRRLQADRDGEGWRQLALGFIENQVFAQAMANEDHSAAKARPVQRTGAGKSLYYWSMAASLLAGWFLAGSWHGVWDNDHAIAVNDATINEPTVNAPTVQEAPEPNFVSVPQAIPVTDRQGFMPVNLQSPQDFRVPAYFSQEIRRQLESQGYALENERQYYHVPLQDGRQLVIPSDTVRVRYAVQ